MIYKTLQHALLGFGLLATLPATAQGFDSELQLSVPDGTTCWYRICNTAAGMDGLAMTDLHDAADDAGQDQANQMTAIFLVATETEDFRSQWKLSAGADGRIIITNRATGFQISNASVGVADHNITLLTSSETPGFVATAIGDNAFRLESVEDDGVNRCLALADKDAGPTLYPESSESTSVVGWQFLPVEIETGIGTTKTGHNVVRVAGKHISVSGSSDWHLYNAQGEEMPRTVALPTGVYMVRLPQGTVKLAIP